MRNENNSYTILRALAAALIIFIPAIAETINFEIAMPLLAGLLCVIFAWRSVEMGKIYISFVQFPVMILLCYAVITSFFAADFSGHINYIIILFMSVLTANLTVDYLFSNSMHDIKKRFIYIFSVSGAFCGLWQIVLGIMNYSLKKQAFIRSDTIALIMISAFVCSLKLFAEQRRKKRFFIIALFSVVVFFINCSIQTVIIAGAFAAVYMLNNKKKVHRKNTVVLLTAAITCITLLLIIITGNIRLFKDCMDVFIKNPAGIGGGGFISGQQMYASAYYKEVKSIGTFFAATTASGVLGFVISILFLLWTIILYIRCKSVLSMLSMLVTACLMVIPVNYAAIVLWTGLLAANDYDTRLISSLSFAKRRTPEIMSAAGALAIILALMAALSGFKIYAESLYRDKRYERAASILKIVGTINMTDSESLHYLALCISENDFKNWQEADAVITHAQKRTKNSAKLHAAEATVLYNGKQYKSSSQSWESAVHMAPFNDEYKISYANALYKWIKTEKYGSSEAKRIYDMMINLSENTENLETKKSINDLTDKAFEYTREKRIVAEEYTDESSDSEG